MSLSTLLAVAGSRATLHAPLGARTTYRVGGRAAVLLELATRDDVAALVPLARACEQPLIVVGKGSNMLVADGDLDLIAIVVTGAFDEVTWETSTKMVRVTAGAGIALPVLARRLAAAGIVGFEWAVGVPGSIGGAVAMNAGGHGSDMATSVHSVELFDNDFVIRSRDDMDFTYRHSSVRQELVLSTTLDLAPGDPTLAKARVDEIVSWRREHQPGGRNGGSVFMNPPAQSAGALLEAAGLKGQRFGGAMVSDKHANFIVVDESATALDVFTLMRLMRERVREDSGITLHPENRLVGFSEEL